MAQVLVAEYSFKTYFKIPLGMVLEDTKIIKDFFIKWNTLYIQFVDENKETLEIESCYDEEPDMKYPTNEHNYDFGNLEDYDFLIDELEEA